MRCLLFLILLPFLFAPAATAQTAPTDSQTLQALLAEVRHLRHDLQSTTATAQRAQITLYRLQRQDEAVVRADQRHSDARSKLANVVSVKNETAAQIQKAETLEKNSQSSEERSHYEEVELPRLKSRFEVLRKEEQQARAHEAEAQQQLQDEQVKLDGLNDILDRLNIALEEMGQK